MRPVSAPGSRYTVDGLPDYSHRFHAGNVGDVWKHCALVELLRFLAATPGRPGYLESHAGEGHYPLGPTGEWTEGIGRLWNLMPERDGDEAVGRYVELCRCLGRGGARPAAYPGSPAFAAQLLGPEATLRLWERDPAARARLAGVLGNDPRVRLESGDGLVGLAEAVVDAETRADAVLVLVDPPYGAKADWLDVPDAFAAAALASVGACLALWYPVKSLTRPNAMLDRLAQRGVAGVAIEVLTTPLDQRRNRLNGSGLVLVRAPDGVIRTLAASAAGLGVLCATRPGTWSVRMRAF